MLNRALSAGLALTAVFVGAQSSFAQVIIQEEIVPQSVILEQPLHVIEAPVVVPRPATTIVSPIPATTTTIIEETTVAPAVPSTSTETMTSTSFTLPRPNIQARLNHLNEHISFGFSKGWVTPTEQSVLRNEHNRVAALATGFASDGLLSNDEIASIEKELTILSYKITEAFNQRSVAGRSLQFQ
jgi:hypothetical protein